MKNKYGTLQKHEAWTWNWKKKTTSLPSFERQPSFEHNRWRCHESLVGSRFRERRCALRRGREWVALLLLWKKRKIIINFNCHHKLKYSQTWFVCFHIRNDRQRLDFRLNFVAACHVHYVRLRHAFNLQHTTHTMGTISYTILVCNLWTNLKDVLFFLSEQVDSNAIRVEVTGVIGCKRYDSGCRRAIQEEWRHSQENSRTPADHCCFACLKRSIENAMQSRGLKIWKRCWRSQWLTY